MEFSPGMKRQHIENNYLITIVGRDDNGLALIYDDEETGKVFFKPEAWVRENTTAVEGGSQ